MKLVFVSNYFNHHQKSLSDELYRITTGKYAFIETAEMDSARTELGWMNTYNPDYVHNISDVCTEDLIKSADTVIFGSVPKHIVQKLTGSDKLILRYSERPLKHGVEPLRFIPRFLKWHRNNPRGKKIQLLCASAFTSSDYRKFGLFKNCSYKWGYFPQTRRYDNLDELFARKDRTELLWCGRYLGLKHPDDALWVAGQLRQMGFSFQMRLIGTGPMEEQLADEIRREHLENCVSMIGPMKPEDVRNCMEHAGIFLFTSGREEGWGVVVNEAMNSGCAVVASHLAGSVPYLIRDKENGLVYTSGSREQLLDRAVRLLQSREMQRMLGEAAYHTITDLWNAEVAAERLINLCEHILSGEKAPVLYSSGPCSLAEIVRESWYRE